MKKNIFTIALAAIAMVLFSTNDAEAQLPEGNIGIGASIGGGGNAGAQLFYAVAQDLDVALTLGYSSYSQDVDGVDAVDVLNIGLQGRYLFLEPSNTIDPYLSFGFTYGTDASLGDDYNSIAIMLAYGLQAELVKNVYLFAQLGIGYEMIALNSDRTDSRLSFGGSRLGAIIYMED